MGILSSGPSGSTEDSGGGDADVGADDSADDAAQAQEVEQTTAPEPSKPVPVPDRPLSRRARAAASQQSLEREIKDIRETVSKSTSDYQRQLGERDAEIARLRGSFETYQRVATERAQPAKPSAQDLHDKALEALKEGRFDEYSKLERQSVLSEIEASRPQQQYQQQQSPGFDPRLQAVIMTTPAAQKVMTHEKGMQMAILMDQELATVYNIPDGPDRWKRAFEIAEQRLNGGKQQPNGFSANGRNVLAGVGHTGNGTGTSKNGTPHVQLPTGWESWARAAGMTREEYARSYADLHPDKISDE